MFRALSNLSIRRAGAAASGGGGVNTKDIEAILMQDQNLNCEMCNVKDVSGGCGSFIEVSVESNAFRGKTVLQQHRMVTAALKKEIPQLHGLTIKTDLPPKEFLRTPPGSPEGKSEEKK